MGNENITITSDTANSPEAKSAKEDAMEFVEQNFPSVKLPRQEIERGFRFWDAVCLLLLFLPFVFLLQVRNGPS